MVYQAFSTLTAAGSALLVGPALLGLGLSALGLSALLGLAHTHAIRALGRLILTRSSTLAARQRPASCVLHKTRHYIYTREIIYALASLSVTFSAGTATGSVAGATAGAAGAATAGAAGAATGAATAGTAAAAT